MSEEKKEEIIEQETEKKNTIRAQLEELKKRRADSNKALISGKGRLRLEKPILCMDEEIKELAYDFTELTGMEYVDAMDTDPDASNVFKTTYRQNLALFAQAAAKQTDGLDMRDILERIGITDATAGAQLAALFFNASTRAGLDRISTL